MNIDRGDQFADALKASFPDYVIGELAEEAFDQIKPGGAGRSKVQVDARVLGHPRGNDRMLVGGVIVNDQVQRELRRSLAVDRLEERQPFFMGVLRGGRAQNPAVQIVHRGEKRDRAVPNVVVRAGADVTEAQRQTGLGSLQRLALALFVAAQDQCPVGRVKVQTDDIPKLRLEFTVAGQLEGPRHVRFELVGRPNPTHRRRRNADLSGHAPSAPSGLVRRWLRRQCDQLLLLRFGNRRLAASAWRVLQARKAEPPKTMLPMHHHGAVHAHRFRRIGLAAASRPQQDDPRSPHHPLRRGRRTRNSFEFHMLR